MKTMAPSRPTRSGRLAVTCALLLIAPGCASVPPPSAPPPAAIDQKVAWILRLEDHRVLRDAPPAGGPPAAAPAAGKRAPVVAPPPPPDLLVLLRDSDARVRRRAALAVGRVGLPEGVAPLAALLSGDRDPAVRQMAAFALGLLGDRAAVAPLRVALADPELLVQGRAAEALGLIGDAESACGHRRNGDAARRASCRDRRADRRRGGVARAAGGGVPPWRRGAGPAEGLRTPGRRGARRERPAEGAVVAGRLRAAAHGGSPRVAGADRLRERRRQLRARVRGARPRGPEGSRGPAPAARRWRRTGSATRRVAISAVRALGQIGDSRAAGPLLAKLLQTRSLDPLLRIEVVAAAGATHAPAALDILLDRLADPSPAIRAAALTSAARDRRPGVSCSCCRGSTRTATGACAPRPRRSSARWTARAPLPLLTSMLADADLRVVPAVLAALAKLQAPGVASILLERLAHEDVVIRAAAAAQLGRPAAPRRRARRSRLPTALGVRDALPVARAAALEALAKYGAAALPVLREAFADRDWAVRLKAAGARAHARSGRGCCRRSGRRRPATRRSTTSHGRWCRPRCRRRCTSTPTAARSSWSWRCSTRRSRAQQFVSLARRGFFNGLAWHRVVPNFVVQDGDPRGDGEGGPGYTIRDELNQRPYLRGTVGMALDGPDTGGSQFFITHSPQPHLDGRYTVFGRVVSGMDGGRSPAAGRHDPRRCACGTARRCPSDRHAD